MANGRFAPSPTGALHLGNLRTALVAWMFARHRSSAFVVRMEDLDRIQSRPEHEAGQLRDLAAIGIDWDGEVVRQSERFERYEAAITTLVGAGRTYPCYCTRREIREAIAAPHVDPRSTGGYPGTCRNLTGAQVAQHGHDGRPPALRLRGPRRVEVVHDDVLGPVRALVDDVVLRRNDGVPAYNLAVVVDDADQGVEQVVRGDDLASSTPSQAHLASLLGLAPVTYAHIPLVFGPTGDRLAKRDGAVTLGDQVARGRTVGDVVGEFAASLGLVDAQAAMKGQVAMTAQEVLAVFDPAAVGGPPWILGERTLGPGGTVR